MTRKNQTVYSMTTAHAVKSTKPRNRSGSLSILEDSVDCLAAYDGRFFSKCLWLGFRRAVIGFIFGFAGFSKIAAIDRFYPQVQPLFRSETVAMATTLLIPSFELVLAAGAFVGGQGVFLAVRQQATLLAFVFLGYHGLGIIRPQPRGCGCFGGTFFSESETAVAVCSCLAICLASFDRSWFRFRGWSMGSDGS